MPCISVLSRVTITALLFSVKLDEPAYISVEPADRSKPLRRVDDLELCHWIYTTTPLEPVYDGYMDSFSLPLAGVNSHGPVPVRFTVYIAPQQTWRPVNSCIKSWLGVDSAQKWRGNVVIVARNDQGVPIHFDAGYASDCKALLAELIHFNNIRMLVRVANRLPLLPPSFCDHRPELDLYRPGLTTQLSHWRGTPPEVVIMFFDTLPLKSLIALTKTSPLERQLVHDLIRLRVLKMAGPFFRSRNDLDVFLRNIQDLGGFTFGAVPVSVMLNIVFEGISLEVSIPRGRLEHVLALIYPLGYVKHKALLPNDACRSIYEVHHITSGRRIVIYESFNFVALIPVLASQCTAAMTILTAGALYSFYTDLTEDLIGIGSAKS